jgi:Ice-binding-like
MNKIVNKMPFIALLLAIFLAGCNSGGNGASSGGASSGPSALTMGSAANFAVLAGSTVTQAGTSTTISGDLGLFPGTSCTGLPSPCTGGSSATVVTGTIHLADNAAALAQTASTAAYNNAKNQTGGNPIVGPGKLDGLNLAPGVYTSGSTMDLGVGTTLTLTGNSTAVWIFQVGSALTINSGAKVLLAGGAQASNVFWQVTTDATLGTGSVFNGTILALSSITLKTNANVNGRVLAQIGAVTLDTNTVTK